MKLGVRGRVALVGGSSSGLGYATAERLAIEGARVLVVSRSAERVERAVRRLRQVGDTSVEGYAVDLTEPDGPARAVAAAAAAFEAPPTVVVANGGGPPSMPALAADSAAIEAAMRLLLLPVQRLLHATLDGMRAAGWGRFVAITSVAVRQPQPGLVLSNALRAAVTGYLRSVADEVAADGITVNTVCPGYTATERLDELAAAVATRDGVAPADVIAGWAAKAPLGRLLEPAEVAAAVAFLCSSPASGITGVALAVDGGLSRSLL
jgi:3-oxoacyl-[acyl-carrier protein] reductase